MQLRLHLLTIHPKSLCYLFRSQNTHYLVSLLLFIDIVNILIEMRYLKSGNKCQKRFVRISEKLDFPVFNGMYVATIMLVTDIVQIGELAVHWEIKGRKEFLAVLSKRSKLNWAETQSYKFVIFSGPFFFRKEVIWKIIVIFGHS